MENILENTSDSIWAIDKNCQILYLNNAFKIDFQKAFGVELKQRDNILENYLQRLVLFGRIGIKEL